MIGLATAALKMDQTLFEQTAQIEACPRRLVGKLDYQYEHVLRVYPAMYKGIETRISFAPTTFFVLKDDSF